MGATVFSILVTIVIAGWLWFYVVRPILEGWGIIKTDDVMSSVQIERTAPATSTALGSTSTHHAVLPDTHQAEPSALLHSEPPLNLHNMSRPALIALISVQKTETGAYRWTANQIAAFVGGTRAEVLKEIAQYRPPLPAPAQIKRPVNGWQP